MLRLQMEQQEVMCGVRVHYGEMDESRRVDAAATVGAALELLLRVKPSRVARLQRENIAIFIVPGQGVHSYSPQANVIVLDLTELSALTARGAACVIVHESTHARFSHAGIQ